MKYCCITLLAVLCAGLLTASAWAEDLDYKLSLDKSVKKYTQTDYDKLKEVMGEDYYLNDHVNGWESDFLKDILPKKVDSYADYYTYNGKYSGVNLKKVVGENFEEDFILENPLAINQYMIGSISVIVILPESSENSSNTEDWTDEEIEAVHNNITKGFSWWADMNPDAHLEFNYTFYDRVEIDSEPIEQSGSFDWWLIQLSEALGYPCPPTYWGSWIDLINDKRIEQGTDWGLIVIVADSSADSDGKFADGLSAFVPGIDAAGTNPYTVMTYDNANWGIEHMEDISAHEMGHIFGAQDEYSVGDYICSCTSHTGYLSYENQNCDNDCLLDEHSIMRHQLHYYENLIDYYARGQIGWHDEDGDGILDILDTFPCLDLAFIECPSRLNFRFSGSAGVNFMPAVSEYYRASTLNTIAAVEYRIDGGPWLPAAPIDGEFDGPEEDYSLDISIEPGAIRLLECRARNSVGNHSEIASAVLDGVTGVPSAAGLLALRAYPNPLNPRTTVRFTLAEAGHAALRVYDVGGREVRALFDGGLEAGEQAFAWDGCDDAGRAMASGTYFVRLETDGGGSTAKVTLAR